MLNISRLLNSLLEQMRFEPYNLEAEAKYFFFSKTRPNFNTTVCEWELIWSLTQFYVGLCEKSLICLEGKSSGRWNLFRSFQQLHHLSLAPLKVSFQGTSTLPLKLLLELKQPMITLLSVAQFPGQFSVRTIIEKKMALCSWVNGQTWWEYISNWISRPTNKLEVDHHHQDYWEEA